MPLWSQDNWVRAWEYASRAHQGQTYATPNPDVRLDYITHIGAVAMELAHALASDPAGLDADFALQCALLHDVLEDTATTHLELASMFGVRVADGVAALSKNTDLPYSEQIRDSLARIRQQPQEVWAVKLADRINNLSEPPSHWTLERKQAYQAEALLIHSQLHSAHPLLAERLMKKINDYVQYYRPNSA